MKSARIEILLLIVVILRLAVSAIHPRDLFTWFLEVLPISIGLPILVFTFKRFRFTQLVYLLIAIHACILILGARYTYAEVPFGFWIRDLFGLERNHYDRLGHFAQGFIPAIIVREMLIRKVSLARGGWLFFLVTCVCMAISVTYEFLEWGASLASGEAADAFLGTQGDVWDTQWDMFLATVGAIFAQLLLARTHDKQLSNIPAGPHHKA